MFPKYKKVQVGNDQNEQTDGWGKLSICFFQPRFFGVGFFFFLIAPFADHYLLVPFLSNRNRDMTSAFSLICSLLLKDPSFVFIITAAVVGSCGGPKTIGSILDNAVVENTFLLNYK